MDNITKEVDKIFINVREILVKKNKNYGSASFDLGVKGNVVHLWDKVSRYKSMCFDGNNNDFESVEDTLKDIIGYAVIGLIILGDEHKKKV